VNEPFTGARVANKRYLAMLGNLNINSIEGNFIGRLGIRKNDVLELDFSLNRVIYVQKT
jgi:hypothetical protein